MKNIFNRMRYWLKGDDSSSLSSHLFASLLTMAWFVEARDPYTGGHLWRVSRYARLLADAAGFDEAEATRISIGGFLHDLGKVGVPDAILRKPDRLTQDEYAIIKTHPDTGMKMLSSHPLAQLVSDAVLMHHERPDGQGYPSGLKGEAIPCMARIVGICDAFDAMTSHRPYRAGMPRGQALDIINKASGQQFDHGYAQLFISLGERGELDHIMGHSDDGIPLQTCPMCGPTLVVQRDNTVGDHLYCHNCGGEFVLQTEDAMLQAKPTGNKGSASDLQATVDAGLIARTVAATVAALPVNQLIKDSVYKQHESV